MPVTPVQRMMLSDVRRTLWEELRATEEDIDDGPEGTEQVWLSGYAHGVSFSLDVLTGVLRGEDE